jgi:3-isopropylmalate/(R)-2-methylmalate dehydratase large subunit
MGLNLAEKVIGGKAGKTVSAGDYVVVDVDKMYIHEGSGPLALNQLERIGLTEIARPTGTFVFLDHSAPSPDRSISNNQKKLREFARQTGSTLYDIGDGICHEIMAAGHIAPGDIVMGGDSHSCTAGALCAFSTGMGSTDMGVILAYGQTWLKVPETTKFDLRGRFNPGVYAKDLILYIIGMIGSDGATYKSMEFVGQAVASMAMQERLTVSNMVVEAGAKVGLFPSDEETRRFLEARGRPEKWTSITPDPDAAYEGEHPIDLNSLEPMVACPHVVDQVIAITDDRLRDTKIDQAFLGSCTNARLEDLKIAADILQKQGGKIHKDVRFIVNPASREVYEAAMEQGILSMFNHAGASINTPGCGVCMGGHQGVLADGEVAIGCNNRNFRGRFGNPEAFVYLGSPATVVASAIRGFITDPREVM